MFSVSISDNYVPLMNIFLTVGQHFREALRESAHTAGAIGCKEMTRSLLSRPHEWGVNSKRWAAIKGFNDPMRYTGTIVSGLTWEIEKESPNGISGAIGWPAGLTNITGIPVGRYAEWNELGLPGVPEKPINPRPARPFVRSAFMEMEDNIFQRFEHALFMATAFRFK